MCKLHSIIEVKIVELLFGFLGAFKSVFVSSSFGLYVLTHLLGTTASVNVVDESKQTLVIKKLDHISKFHNFNFGVSGIKAWKAYGIGKGKSFPYKEIYITHQGPTELKTTECFFEPSVKARDVKSKSAATEKKELFECNVPGCTEVFASVEAFEKHLDVGKHVLTGSVYDQIRKDWAAKFQSMDDKQDVDRSVVPPLPLNKSNPTKLEMGWALKQPSACARFSENVKEYLTAKFILGEKTGLKADPSQVAKDMRNARGLNNERRFSREEWLTKSQIKGFFSRFAASRRKNIVGFSVERQDDIECVVEDLERQELLETINDKIGLKHPITYDDYDLCQYNKDGKLHKLNVAMLKGICTQLEVPLKSKDKKNSLLEKLKDIICQCECCSLKV